MFIILILFLLCIHSLSVEIISWLIVRKLAQGTLFSLRCLSLSCLPKLVSKFNLWLSHRVIIIQLCFHLIFRASWYRMWLHFYIRIQEDTCVCIQCCVHYAYKVIVQKISIIYSLVTPLYLKHGAVMCLYQSENWPIITSCLHLSKKYFNCRINRVNPILLSILGI